MSYPLDPARKVRDDAIDTKSRELLKSDPYLQRLSRENPSKALKEAVRAAGRIVDGKDANLPAI